MGRENGEGDVYILTCRFYYVSVMARPKGQAQIAIEKIACYTHRSRRRGLCLAMGATWGCTRVGQEAEGMGGNVNKSLYCDFCGKEEVRQRKQA